MKNKKLKVSIISLALVAVVGIGGTLAYLSTKTNEKTNTFTMGTGISGELVEPKWDEVGAKDAQNFVPGRVIDKDPQVKNESPEGTVDAYVAVKLTYGKDVASAAEIEKFADIDWNTKDWTFNEDHTIAYYNYLSKAQTTTTTLFNTVTIKDLALTKAQIDSVGTDNVQFDQSKYPDGNWADFEMENFDIQLQGYLVQSEGFDSAEAAMTEAFPEEFK